MEKNRCPECKNILYSVDELFYDKDGIRPAKYCAECYKLFESHSFGLVEKKHKTFVSKRIAELEAEIERLSAALKQIAGSGPVNYNGEYDPYAAWSWCYDIANKALKQARRKREHKRILKNARS